MIGQGSWKSGGFSLSACASRMRRFPNCRFCFCMRVGIDIILWGASLSFIIVNVILIDYMQGERGSEKVLKRSSRFNSTPCFTHTTTHVITEPVPCGDGVKRGVYVGAREARAGARLSYGTHWVGSRCS